MDNTNFVGVLQTEFGNPTGNCASACIATILGIPLCDVPTFFAHFDQMEDGQWGTPEQRKEADAHIRTFLAGYGYARLSFRPSDVCWDEVPDGQIFEAVGPSPRHAGQHAVVFQLKRSAEGEVLMPLWDPHPDGTFFAGRFPDWVAFYCPVFPGKVPVVSL